MLARIRYCAIACIVTLCGHTTAWAADFTFDLQYWQTKKGANVYLVEVNEIPMLDIKVTFDAGSARDGNQQGAANLVSGLLEEGTLNFTADEIAQGFESLGAVFSAGSYRDMSMVNLRVLSDEKYLAPAVNIFTETISAPDFNETAIQRVKGQVFSALAHDAANPASIATKAFYKSLYGNHPYANPTIGTKKSVEAISRADLQSFHKKYFVAKNMTITLVGNINRKRAETLADLLSQDLPTGSKAGALPPVTPLEEAQQTRIQFPSQQTHIHLGVPGIQRGSPDHVALYVGNHILGGSGLVSKLTEEVREKRGLTYGVFSYFIPMRAQGPFIVNLQTRNEAYDEALSVTKNVIQDFVEKGPTEAELKAAKQNILGSFVLNTSSNNAIASQVASIGFYQLPLTYLNDFHRAVEKVTAEEIKAAFQRHIQLDKSVLVSLGKLPS